MEVTRKNFKEVLPLVEESIKKAEFLVIDAEFTGLLNGRDASMFDTPEDYYGRLYNGASEFLLIQYGLCAFYWDAGKKQYMNDAYNFYLFPRGKPEKIFMCQSSSLDFLAAQGFDFNKLIKEGISYMTEPAESKAREYLSEKQKSYAKELDIILIPEENKQQVDDICKQVREFLDKDEQPDMEIDKCNAFIRRLLFQELRVRFKGEVYVETKILENKSRVLKVSRIGSSNENKFKEDQRKEREWEELEDTVGFSKVARMISQSGKLVVGHNMLLDIIHTLNHFFHPLPEDYTSFKEFAHCMFPSLLDTKYMSSLPPFKDAVNSSVLLHLYNTLSNDPFGVPKTGSESGRGYAQAADKHHEAGFDAFVTGLCFLAMRAHVARMRGDAPAPALPSPALRPFLNKLYLARTAHQDSPYMNLDGPDPSPTRDHVFHMTFPMEWQRSDINHLFSPFGPVIVQFLDDTSAVVALQRREQARDVTRLLSRHAQARLVPYAKFKSSKRYLRSRSAQRTLSSGSPQPTLPSGRESEAAGEPIAREPKRVATPPPPSPTKVARTRSTSLSAPTTPSTPSPAHTGTRKRTSSGVFQVDDAEPPPKKIEVKEVSRKKPEINGRKKVPTDKGDENWNKDIKKQKDKKTTVAERFDSQAKGNTVTAFKESDSWD